MSSQCASQYSLKVLPAMLYPGKGFAGGSLMFMLLSPEEGMAICVCISKAFEQVIHEAVVPQASHPDELLQPCSAHPVAIT